MRPRQVNAKFIPWGSLGCLGAGDPGLFSPQDHPIWGKDRREESPPLRLHEDDHREYHESYRLNPSRVYRFKRSSSV